MRIPAFAVALLLAAGTTALAATSPPKATPAAKATAPPRIDVLKAQPKSLAPKTALHVEYTVEINKLGQVARVRTVKPSHNQPFDEKTYGNALQAFIRTPEGQVVVGTYKLIYDYDPRTMRVRRDVALVKAGGVDPEAKGAATDMMEIARRNRDRTPPPSFNVTPGPAPSVNIHRMPDLNNVMKASPSPGH
jgi:hypothetical protein